MDGSLGYEGREISVNNPFTTYHLLKRWRGLERKVAIFKDNAITGVNEIYEKIELRSG